MPSCGICRSGTSTYLHSRTHLALDKDTPFSRSVAPPSAGRVVATPQVGGLHHRYDRIAA
jgi:putative transposase